LFSKPEGKRTRSNWA